MALPSRACVCEDIGDVPAKCGVLSLRCPEPVEGSKDRRHPLEKKSEAIRVGQASSLSCEPGRTGF